MAEALTKKLFGGRIFVQSTGVKHDMEVDGFAVAVCEEIDVDLSDHKSRSFDEMEQWGDEIGAYDLIVALTPASQRRAQEYTRHHSLAVEYWPILDPTQMGRTREEKLDAYRQTRDQIIDRIQERFGRK
jgi:arsenate reductase